MIQESLLKIKLKSTKKQITAHSGLILPAVYSLKLKLNQIVNKFITNPKHVTGAMPAEYVNHFCMIFWGGGRALEDVRILKEDTALQKLLASEKILSSDALGNWLRAKGATDISNMRIVMQKILNKIMSKETRTKYTLDVDATQIETSKKEAKYSYKKVKAYMPMLGTLAENELCIHEEFREGNVSPGAGHLQFYKDCVKNMPKGKQIALYRADSASYKSDLINALEKDKVKYAIVAPKNIAIWDAIKNIPEEDWQSNNAGEEYAWTTSSMEKTDKGFNLSIKRTLIMQPLLIPEGPVEKYAYHVVATNIEPESNNKGALHQWYNKRGQSENINKEVKAGIGLERMPCGQFIANAMYFRLGILAYNIFVGFKIESCPKSWQKHTIATYRWRLFNIAGSVTKGARQIYLKLKLGAERMQIFEEIFAKILMMKT